MARDCTISIGFPLSFSSSQAKPFQAGIASFIMFLSFGAIPFLSCIFIPNRWALIGVCVGVTLFLLALCGAIGSYFGGAPLWKGT